MIDFYSSISSFLKDQNVSITADQDFTDKHYIIKVNGENYTIYNEEELESADIWELSTVRSFTIVNCLLKEARSNERIFWLYGGNDLRAIFLTDEQYKEILNSKVLSEKELPQKVSGNID
ncbi:MAG TPA: hypothetical protein VHT96_18285 [Clostridia bacterium]|nr:hypothetical protein [Clostridia bacterium]